MSVFWHFSRFFVSMAVFGCPSICLPSYTFINFIILLDIFWPLWFLFRKALTSFMVLRYIILILLEGSFFLSVLQSRSDKPQKRISLWVTYCLRDRQYLGKLHYCPLKWRIVNKAWQRFKWKLLKGPKATNNDYVPLSKKFRGWQSHVTV